MLHKEDYCALQLRRANRLWIQLMIYVSNIETKILSLLLGSPQLPSVLEFSGWESKQGITAVVFID